MSFMPVGLWSKLVNKAVTFNISQGVRWNNELFISALLPKPAFTSDLFILSSPPKENTLSVNSN